MIHGENMISISPLDLSDKFNSYALKNVIVLEEALIEQQNAMEKLKENLNR